MIMASGKEYLDFVFINKLPILRNHLSQKIKFIDFVVHTR